MDIYHPEMSEGDEYSLLRAKNTPRDTVVEEVIGRRGEENT